MFFKTVNEKRKKLTSLKEELKWLAKLSKNYKKEISIVTLTSVS